MSTNGVGREGDRSLETTVMPNSDENSVTISVALMDGHNGGKLRRGNPGNKGGTGVPPSAIRAYCRGSFAVRIPILEQIADGELMEMTVSHRGKVHTVKVMADLKDRVKAIDTLAKYGGIEKLPLMPDELPDREITPELVADRWRRLRMITSIEELEAVMVDAAQKQIADGVT